jgi:uncharacterized membrane protein YhhN
VNQRPPQLSPRRLAAGLLLPLAAYLVIRALIGSATGALAITEAGPAAWLVLGIGLIVTIWYFRLQKDRRERARRPPTSLERDG